MTALQAFVLGAMVAWTPSLIVAAFLFWRAPLIDFYEWRPTRETTEN
jgi:hypothetical protein